MKRALIAAAAGAIGALGTAGLMAAAPAQAQTCAEDTPPLTPTRVVCLINEQTGTFFMSVNPANQLNTFFNGTDSEECDASGCTTVNDGLGILDQPQTFVNSLADFFNGPVSP
jgi:hypothetical protein